MFIELDTSGNILSLYVDSIVLLSGVNFFFELKYYQDSGTSNEYLFSGVDS